MTTRILCLCLASLFLVACDDGGGNSVSGSTMCVGTFSVATRAQLGSAVSATGACTSSSDLDAVCTEDLRTISGTCALTDCISLLSNPTELQGCMQTCVDAATAIDPSPACTDCYTATVLCTAQNCLTDCTADSNSVACQTCQYTKGCTSAFFACSGLPLPTAFVGGDI